MTRNEQRLVLICVIVACAGLLFLFLNRYRFYYNYVNIALREREKSSVRARENSSDTKEKSGPAEADRAPRSAGEKATEAITGVETGRHFSGGAGSRAPAGTGVQGTAAPDTARKIDINRAGLEDLMSLPGIGRVTALNIIEYRTRAGGFTGVRELEEVKGIGPKKLEAILRYVVVE